MEENFAMKCPFRKNEKSEYMDCYGDKCMAFYEYQSPFASCGSDGTTKNPYPMCKFLMMNPPQQLSTAPYQRTSYVPPYTGVVNNNIW